MLGRTVVRTVKLREITYFFSAAAATVTARGRGFLRLPPGASLVCAWLAGRLRTREINIGHIIKLGDSVYLLFWVKWPLGLLGQGHLWCAGVGEMYVCCRRGVLDSARGRRKNDGYRGCVLAGVKFVPNVGGGGEFKTWGRKGT